MKNKKEQKINYMIGIIFTLGAMILLLSSVYLNNTPLGILGLVYLWTSFKINEVK